MKTRIIETKFWKDPYVINLSVEERLLFLYFLTNERVNILHCYEITEREISFDTGIDRGIIRTIKKKFENDKKMAFNKDFVCLLNAYRYESYTGDKNEKAKLMLLRNTPEDVVEWYRGMYRGMDTPSIPPISHKSEIINHKSKTEELKEKAHLLVGKPI